MCLPAPCFPCLIQVAAAQGACLIFGAHGAGLTHLLFAPPGVRVLELRTPGFMRPHFIAASGWMGARHTDWCPGTSKPRPVEVIERIVGALTMSPGVQSSRT